MLASKSAKTICDEKSAKPVLLFNPLRVLCSRRRLAGIPDFISGDDMDDMISSGRLDPKVVFAYIQEVYRALKDN